MSKDKSESFEARIQRIRDTYGEPYETKLVELETRIQKMKDTGMPHEEICQVLEKENQQRVDKGVNKAMQADEGAGKALDHFNAMSDKHLEGQGANRRYKTIPYLGIYYPSQILRNLNGRLMDRRPDELIKADEEYERAQQAAGDVYKDNGVNFGGNHDDLDNLRARYANNPAYPPYQRLRQECPVPGEAVEPFFLRQTQRELDVQQGVAEPEETSPKPPKEPSQGIPEEVRIKQCMDMGAATEKDAQRLLGELESKYGVTPQAEGEPLIAQTIARKKVEACVNGKEEKQR